MLEMLKLIELKKEELNAHPLFKNLSKNTYSLEENLSFTPAMSFFIMGFTDILKEVKIKDPQTALDHIINTHCDEDADHWMWYLKDLEKLGFSFEDWGGNVYNVFDKLWSDDLHATRKIVYEAIHRVKKANNPIMNFLVIEVMEATFASFVEHVIAPMENTSLYTHLEFFGKTHEHAEENHSLGSWTNGMSIDDYVMTIEISDELKSQAIEMIDSLYGYFSEMFECWNNEKGSIKSIAKVAGPELTESQLQN